jgi:hypothetical protein
MITIRKQDNNFVFEVNGMHKHWAFRSSLTIPKEHIARAYQDTESIEGWKGWKIPGTYIPYLITAGTFYKDGDRIFWDACNMHQCIIVELHDEDFQKLIIEVEDPKEAIALLTGR